MYLISYDIENNKIRNKIAKTLEDYGKRVQYSVFECHIDQERFQTLYMKLAELMEEEEKGNIRFYQICLACEKKTVVMGVENELLSTINDDTIII